MLVFITRLYNGEVFEPSKQTARYTKVGLALNSLPYLIYDRHLIISSHLFALLFFVGAVSLS